MLRFVAYLTYLLIAFFSFSLYRAWQGKYLILAVLQGPILVSAYTVFLFVVKDGFKGLLTYLYFILYFTTAVLVLFGISFNCCGYGGFLVSMLASALCGLLYIKGIKLFLDGSFAGSLSAGFFTGLISYILYLLLLVPVISDLLLPMYRIKDPGNNIFAPLFFLWISAVSLVVVWRLALRFR